MILTDKNKMIAKESITTPFKQNLINGKITRRELAEITFKYGIFYEIFTYTANKLIQPPHFIFRAFIKKT